MRTGNGQNGNPRKEFPGPYKKDTSNLVKPSTGKKFSAKKDSYKSKSV